MPTIPKIQTSLYAIGKRLQAYHLLKNPKGTPQTEINMIKESLYGTTTQWDDIFYINRIKKTFLKNQTENEKKFLMSTHFFDIQNLQMTKPRKKDIVLSIHKNDKFVNLSERHDLAWEQCEKRIIKKLSLKKSSFLSSDNGYDKIYLAKQEAELERGYYKRHYSLLSKIISLGMYKRIFYPQENRPNFFKVLYQNLTNK